MNLKESWGISSGDPPTEKSHQLYLCPYLRCAPSLREGFPSSTSCLPPRVALGVRGPWSVCLLVTPSAEVEIWEIEDPVLKGMICLFVCVTSFLS